MHPEIELACRHARDRVIKLDGEIRKHLAELIEKYDATLERTSPSLTQSERELLETFSDMIVRDRDFVDLIHDLQQHQSILDSFPEWVRQENHQLYGWPNQSFPIHSPKSE